MPSVFAGRNLQKKEEKDFGRNKSINTPPADIFSSKYLQQFFTHQSQTGKKNQDQQKIFDTMGNKDRVIVMTLLQWVQTPMS